MTKKEKICVGEEFRIAVTLAIQRFRLNEDQKEHEFPSSFTSVERAYVHRYCSQLGLKSKSRGEGANRYLTVYKKEGSTIVQADAVFELGRVSRQHSLNLLQRYPVSARERQELLPPTERDRMLGQDARDLNRTTGRLNNGIPQVPPRRGDSELSAFRQSLPIWNQKDEIVHTILRHQVVLITGHTGCGKTTQVPQYILDHCHVIGQPCRIICTQPRRLAALSVAERVAVERDDKVGQTVGYQIRLESRVSPKTLLTFCTNGVLLRTLMGGDASMATVTHIIVDEVHERDRFSDFLLVILKDLLTKFRNLKLILMSASLDVQLFVKYFGGCPVIEVPSRNHEVHVYFLEDILKHTNYVSKAMEKYKKDLNKLKNQRQQLASWCSNPSVVQSNSTASTLDESSKKFSDSNDEFGSSYSSDVEISSQKTVIEKAELEPQLAADMDQALQDAWLTGSDDDFAYLLQLIMNENVNVDYQHSETSVTALMVAAGRGNINCVEQLLALGANVRMRASNEWTAINWANHFGQKEVQELLEANWSTSSEVQMDGGNLNSSTNAELEVSDEDKELLDIYHHSFDDEKVDMNLILCLLHKICSSQDGGAVLIFLPGYDEIVSLRERILNDEQHFPDTSRFMIYTLHSHMQCSDQKRVFKPVLPGVRKIILSTNIAETSITINDVVFVIDSGKVKEKCFDALTGVTSLKSGWVSQASAIQRRGRAGRCQPGICYHMLSKIRFNNMPQFQVPEILRVPIHELCLQAKLLAPPNIPIADYLARAPDPPAFMVTRNAVTLLKTIDALDPWEELTELGLHLLDLPIEPRLGKMVLYSVVLKCLDPVLTIVCALAYRDPFLLPSQPAQRRAAALAKKKLAADTNSDHMALLRAFQAWQKARTDGYEHSFCEKNFLSAATMEMIVGMRTQLLGQLRASGFVRARGGGDIRDLNSNSENWAVVKAALCAGTYPNLIRVDRERQQLITQKESKVRFHQSSVLHKPPTSSKQTVASMHAKVVANLSCDWLIYEEMTRTGRIASAHCCTLVSPITVALFAGPARLPLDALHEPDHGRIEGYAEDSDSEAEEKTDGQKAMFKLDDWISFRVEPEAARLTLQLRQKWHALFLRRMHSPAKPWSQVDEAVVRAIVGVLAAEEQALGLQQPAGIGQRPRPMATDFCPPVSMGPQPPSSPGSGGSCHFGTSSPYGAVDMHGMRHGSFDLEASDEGSSGIEPYSSSFPGAGNSYQPTRRNHMEKRHSHGSDERSDSSSVRSVGSGSGSTPISPCTSPAPSSSSGYREKPDAVNVSNSSNVRYYVIKATSPRIIETSLSKGVWAFTPSTERKLLWAIKEGKEVILIFSVQGSGHFQGYARFSAHFSDHRPPEFSAPNLGNCYQIEWLKRANIPFQSTRHLQNPWNENRKVQISRDGQELEPSVGETLCKLWEKVPPFLCKSLLMQGKQVNFHFENNAAGDAGIGQPAQIPSGPWFDTSAPMPGSNVWSSSTS